MSDDNLLNDLNENDLDENYLFSDEELAESRKITIDDETLDSMSLDLDMEKAELRSFMENIDAIHMDGLLNGSISDLKSGISDQELDALLSESEDINELLEQDDDFMKGYKIAANKSEEEPQPYTEEPDTSEQQDSEYSFDESTQYGGGFSDEDFDFFSDADEITEELPPLEDADSSATDSIDELFTSTDFGEFELLPDDAADLPPLESDEEKKTTPKEESVLKKKALQLVLTIKASIKTLLGNVLSFINNIIAKLKKLDKSVLVLGAIIVVLGTALLVAGGFLLKDILYYRKLVSENKVIVNSTNTRTLYNSNFIYTENIKQFNDSELILRKIKLDKNASTFYFNKYLPLEYYSVELTDDLGTYYVFNSRLSKSENDEDLIAPTELWFEGLREEARELTLSIWDEKEKNLVSFEVVLEDFKLPPVRYLTEEAVEISNKYGIVARVDDAAFSSAKSEISYKIESGSDIMLKHGGPLKNSPSDYLSLSCDSAASVPLSDKPNVFWDDGNLLAGSMEFTPLSRLTGGATLTFRSLFIGFDVNKSVNAESLFKNEEGVEIIVDMGKDKLVLERMRKFDEAYVLVYHFESADTGEHVMGEADIDMTIRHSGASTTLTPYVYSNNFGGDMIFEYESPNSLIEEAGPSDVYLNIKSANITLPDMTVNISEDILTDKKAKSSHIRVKNSLTRAFNVRFKNISGIEQGVDSSLYFSGEVLNNEEIMALYENPGATEPPVYSSVVRSIVRTGEDDYIAVVDEAWRYIINEERIYGNKTHNVTVKQIDDSYVIINDTVVK